MKSSMLATIFVLLLVSTIMAENNQEEQRKLGGYKSKSKFRIEVQNLTFLQPFSSFFVMVHSKDAKPLFKFGEEASEPLAILAENGDPSLLVKEYKGMKGVLNAKVVDGPVPPGGSLKFSVTTKPGYDYVTIASMCVNTNDCFVSGKYLYLEDGAKYVSPGLDAGSEENNELCSSIPGPACTMKSGNVRSGNGEGYVHVHRGFFGVNEGSHISKIDRGVSGMPLRGDRYDWRNPMMKLAIYEAY